MIKDTLWTLEWENERISDDDKATDGHRRLQCGVEGGIRFAEMITVPGCVCVLVKEEGQKR